MNANGQVSAFDEQAFYDGGQLRFSSIPSLAEPIIVAGLGSVGSHVAYALTKAGLLTYNFDFDNVEPQNCGVQMYGAAQVGMSKTTAMRQVLNLTFSSLRGSCSFNNERVMDTVIENEHLVSPRRGYAGWISCVDSMRVRKNLLDLAVYSTQTFNGLNRDVPEFEPRTPFFIDARVGMTLAQLYVCNLADDESVARYRETLYSDEEAANDPCNARAHIGASMIAAGLIAEIAVAVAEKRPVPEYMAVDCKAWMTLGLEGFEKGRVGRWRPVLARQGEAPAQEAVEPAF